MCSHIREIQKHNCLSFDSLSKGPRGQGDPRLRVSSRSGGETLEGQRHISAHAPLCCSTDHHQGAQKETQLRVPGLGSRVCLLATRTWDCHSLSLRPSFPICKIGMKITFFFHQAVKGPTELDTLPASLICFQSQILLPGLRPGVTSQLYLHNLLHIRGFQRPSHRPLTQQGVPASWCVSSCLAQ